MPQRPDWPHKHDQNFKKGKDKTYGSPDGTRTTPGPGPLEIIATGELPAFKVEIDASLT